MWDWTYSLRKEICSCDYKDRGDLQTCPRLPPRQKLVHRAKGHERNWVPLVQCNEHTSWHPDKDDEQIRIYQTITWPTVRIIRKDVDLVYILTWSSPLWCFSWLEFGLTPPAVMMLILFSSRYVSSIRYPMKWDGRWLDHGFIIPTTRLSIESGITCFSAQLYFLHKNRNL